MSRPLGGYIGHRPAPATAGLNSAAGGMWTLREAQRFKQAATWPRALPPNTLLAVTFDSGYTDLAQGIAADNTSSGVSLSAAESKSGGQSLLVRAATTGNSATTNRVTYGSGSNWDITGADFTVECWVYSIADGLYQGIACRDNQDDRRDWQLLKMSGAEGNVAHFNVFNTSGGVFLNLSDTDALPTSQWVHVAAVRDSGVLRLYRDGVQRASVNFSSATGTRRTASGPLAVGSINENGNYCWCGYIDELLITTSCRYPNGTTFTPPASL